METSNGDRFHDRCGEINIIADGNRPAKIEINLQ